MHSTRRKMKVVDLFAGAGGLSKGLEDTGVFEVVLAVESHPHFRETYKKNHPGVKVLGDINRIIGNRRFDLLMSKLKEKYGEIDLVVGGPPCQGFSKANRQRNHLISTNNLLAVSFMEFVDKLEPKAFVMENVKDMPGYTFFVSSDPWDQEALLLSGTPLETEHVSLGYAGPVAREMAAYLAQHVVDDSATELACMTEVNLIYPPLRTLTNHVRRGRDAEAQRFVAQRKRFFRRVARLSAESSHLPPFVCQPLVTLMNTLAESDSAIPEWAEDSLCSITSQLSMMAQFIELHENRIRVLGVLHRDGKVLVTLQSYNLADHFIRFFTRKGYSTDYHILEAAQYGVPQRRERVIFIGVKEHLLKGRHLEFPRPILLSESQYYTVEDAIADLEPIHPDVDCQSGPIPRQATSNAPPLARYLQGHAEAIYNHVRTDTREIAQQRYNVLKPGQCFHDLPKSLTATYSDPTRTQLNIYRRLQYEAPAPTVTNVRKAMWVHPTLDRAISIREAARLQSFPDTYCFFGKKDHQYQQVGNAVPPFLARAVGEAIALMLNVTPPETLSDVLRQHPKSKTAQPLDTLGARQ